MPGKRMDPQLAQAALDLITKHGTYSRATNASGIPEATLHKRVARAGALKLQPDPTLAAGGEQLAPDDTPGIDQEKVRTLLQCIRQAGPKQRYVITSAQNATPINKAFFASLLTYCWHNKAQLIVIPYRYRNPTSRWTGKDTGHDWWAPELSNYLLDKRVQLNKNLELLADIKTQPTASSPTSGFESISKDKSAIIGHPKLELKTVPTPQSKLPKILTSTGSVTQQNYIQSKAGKKGEFHHTCGACVVEMDGPLFHMRQINAVKDGSFMDIHPLAQYTPKGVKKGGVSAIVLGDEHEEFLDPQVRKATFGKGGLVEVLKPKYLVRHDVHDFYSRNHHHIGEPFIDYVKHHAGTDDVEKALRKTFRYIDETTPAGTTNIIVSSNHPDALAKWVKRADWRTDPTNAKFLLKTALAMLEGASMTETGARTIDPFVYWGERWLAEHTQVKFLAPDELFLIEGIQVGYHGHYGLNGARGSRKGFARIGIKVVIGHGHSPGIDEGAYQAGMNARYGMEYMRGPSSTLHTDCIIYSNGKRTLINIINGRTHA